MIVKMRFLNISGPRDDIDRVCEKYLSKYEMQIENAVTELKDDGKYHAVRGSEPVQRSACKGRAVRTASAGGQGNSGRSVRDQRMIAGADPGTES